MKIITNEKECNEIIGNYKNSILDSSVYKKILNSHYDPDSFLFFVEGNDFVPLVVKNNLVTLYGCPRFNETDSLPNNETMLNEMFSYLEKEDYDFQLLSIHKDYFGLLEEKNKQYDVPFSVEWHYKNIQEFDKLDILNGVNGRKRRKYKRVLRESQNYIYATMSFVDFEVQFNFLIKAHTDYFSKRGKGSVWENNEDFLFEQLKYFEEKENLLIRTISSQHQVVALYTLVYNNEEMIYFFGTSLKKEDPYISKIMYFDILETAKQIASGTKTTQLNALRGTAVNKKRFGFAPRALYALVKDHNWTVQTDPDIDPSEYDNIYGRDSWGRLKQPIVI